MGPQNYTKIRTRETFCVISFLEEGKRQDKRITKSRKLVSQLQELNNLEKKNSIL